MEKPFGYVWIVSQVLPLGSSYLAYSTLQDVDHNLHLWIIPLTQGGGLRNMFSLNKKPWCHGNTNYKLMIESNWMTLEISTQRSQYSASYPVRIPTLFGRRSTPEKRNKVWFRFNEQLSRPIIGTRSQFFFKWTPSLLLTVWIFMGESHVNVTLLCTTFCLGSGQATLQTFSFPLSPHNLNHHLIHLSFG